MCVPVTSTISVTAQYQTVDGVRVPLFFTVHESHSALSDLVVSVETFGVVRTRSQQSVAVRNVVGIGRVFSEVAVR